jgi:hypothetical protein
LVYEKHSHDYLDGDREAVFRGKKHRVPNYVTVLDRIATFTLQMNFTCTCDKDHLDSTGKPTWVASQKGIASHSVVQIDKDGTPAEAGPTNTSFTVVGLNDGLQVDWAASTSRANGYAAGGAWIGGGIGAGVGAVIGGTAGAAGGTIVAPGIGTGAGGAAGAVSGAVWGGGGGAAIGAGVGGAIGWAMDESYYATLQGQWKITCAGATVKVDQTINRMAIRNAWYDSNTHFEQFGAHTFK